MTTPAGNRHNPTPRGGEEIAPTTSTSTSASSPAVAPSSSAATATIRPKPSTGVLDSTAYPHIFEQILAHCSPLALGRVRGTSRENYHLTNALRYGHVTVWRGSLTNYTSAPGSLEAFGWDPNAEVTDAQNGDGPSIEPDWGYSTGVHPNTLGVEGLKVRMLDVIGWQLPAPSSSPVPELNYREFHTLRLFGSTTRTNGTGFEQFFNTLRPRRLVVDATADSFPAFMPFLPWIHIRRLQRVVLNYNYGPDKGYTALATPPRFVPLVAPDYSRRERRDLVVVLHPHYPTCPAPRFSYYLGTHCACPKPESMSLEPVIEALCRALVTNTRLHVTLVGANEVPFHWLDLGFPAAPEPQEVSDEIICLALKRAGLFTNNVKSSIWWSICTNILRLEAFRSWRTSVHREFRTETMQW